MKRVISILCVILVEACTSSQVVLKIEESNQLQITTLPLELNTFIPLKTERAFDDLEELKEMISVDSLSFIISEADLIPEYEYVDIRVKVEFLTSLGSQDKFFVSNTGLLSYKDRIYEAPDEFMKFIRAYDKSRPIR